MTRQLSYLPSQPPQDWGEASDYYDELREYVEKNDLEGINEAETRLKLIDKMLEKVLGWKFDHIQLVKPEEPLESEDESGYVDYILRTGDSLIALEAKKVGKLFPTVSRKRYRKLFGAGLYAGDTKEAVDQVINYARDKDADLAVTTNGECWIIFSSKDISDDSHAYVYHPFKRVDDAERLFNMLALVSVDAGSLDHVTNKPPTIESRLIATLKNLDGRKGRNNIADLIIPALDRAWYTDSLLTDEDSLKKCYVNTEQRQKYDNQLEIHLAQFVSRDFDSASQIRRTKRDNHLTAIASQKLSRVSPPVTLLLGEVGSGKTTYITYFKKFSGKSILTSQKTHWIYVDFNTFGKDKSPRNFIYEIIRNYLDDNVSNKDNPTDFNNVIRPAYEDKMNSLAKGVMRRLFENDREAFDTEFDKMILSDYNEVEPYVDKVLNYINQASLCVIVLDNVDLYQDEDLETTVFSEGLALSKRVKGNMIISMRDSTYARHRSTPTFNAHELNVLWLEPPDLKAVITRRLSYSKKILENQRGELLIGTTKVNISDLQHFFDTVQRSVLDNEAGYFIESMAERNVRFGLSMITNFLKSGHIEANRAVINYLGGETTYTFPFHEIFKGMILGDRLHYSEAHTQCINVFDARLGVASLQLLRLYLLRELAFRARQEVTLEVPVSDCIRLFSACGASEKHILKVLDDLRLNRLIRVVDIDDINVSSVVSVTKKGAYLSKILCTQLVYVEECMHDTAITDNKVWAEICNLTEKIENLTDALQKNVLRKKRLLLFLDYIKRIETQFLNSISSYGHLSMADEIIESIVETSDYILKRTKFYRNRRK